MTSSRIMLALLAVAPGLAAPALAEDRALVIGNAVYADAATVSGAQAALLAARALEVAGFTVVQGSDLAAADLRSRLSDLMAKVGPQDRVAILLSGHFAHSAGQTWFLGTDTSAPDAVSAGVQGVALATVFDIAAAVPGGAVVLLGTEPRRILLGAGLQPGLGRLDPPQGVALITGDAARIADFAARTLGERGTSLAQMAQGVPDLAATGYLAPLSPFRPGDPDQGPAPDADEALWQASRAIGTPEAFDAYLARFPKGRHAAEATAEAARIRAEPGRQARLAEEALQLSRDDRRAVQRALSLLEFNPRGIDGLFGAGSRTAIAAWQSRNGYEPTSYLTRDQIARLSAQSDRRAAELEAAAAERRAEQERQDRLYWEQTGAAGDEPGLRAYLKRYKDGLFADLATRRLAVIEEARRAQAAAQERAAWDVAQAGDTIASYQDYLAAFPKGSFAGDAQARIDALTQEAASTAERARNEATEAALNLSPVAQRLIEGRLAALSLDPGPVDGTFDDETRRAIRRFQATRDLPATGYLDQATMVSLLADGILKLGE